MQFIFLIAFSLSLAANADAMQFALGSKDGITQIHGQIDIPNCSKPSYPAVLMVAGTGLFTRNAFFGHSRTERDFLFLDLSKKLNDLCIATIRFDYRGVSCDLKSKEDIAKCVDQRLRSTVTDQSILDDIQVVYDFATSQASIEKNKVVLLGHSEGSLNISRLVARKSVTAKAIIFLGGIAESAKGILYWQISERPSAWLKDLDLNHDRILTNDELKLNYSTSPLSGNFPIESLASPSGSWTFAEIDNSFEEIYRSAAADALTHKSSDPYLQGGITFTSYQWWQRWFSDETTVLENLKEFTGPIEYHNGDIDSQAPGKREQAIVQTNLIPMASQPAFVIYSGKGHGLGNDPLYGPIDEDIAESIVSKIDLWVK